MSKDKGAKKDKKSKGIPKKGTKKTLVEGGDQVKEPGAVGDREAIRAGS